MQSRAFKVCGARYGADLDLDLDLDLATATAFGIDPGSRDFYGVNLPVGTALNMGASEGAGLNCPAQASGGSCTVAVPVMPRVALLLLVLGICLLKFSLHAREVVSQSIR